MRRTLFLFLTVLTVSLLGGCQKDETIVEYKSPGEKIGEQIMELAKSNHATHVQLRNTVYREQTFGFKIKGEVLSVYINDNMAHYNLNYVQSFTLEGSPNGKFISIWFINSYEK